MTSSGNSHRSIEGLSGRENKSKRSSRLQMFFKKGVLKNFANFIGKHLCRSLFLLKLQTLRLATLLKRDSNTVFSCKTCEIFKNTFPYRIPPVAASEANQLEKIGQKIVFHVDDLTFFLGLVSMQICFHYSLLDKGSFIWEHVVCDIPGIKI